MILHIDILMVSGIGTREVDILIGILGRKENLDGEEKTIGTILEVGNTCPREVKYQILLPRLRILWCHYLQTLKEIRKLVFGLALDWSLEGLVS